MATISIDIPDDLVDEAVEYFTALAGKRIRMIPLDSGWTESMAFEYSERQDGEGLMSFGKRAFTEIIKCAFRLAKVNITTIAKKEAADALPEQPTDQISDGILS